jgi:cytosine/uracil/thiamine/allantoin permease
MYNYAWFISFGISFALYAILMKMGAPTQALASAEA